MGAILDLTRMELAPVPVQSLITFLQIDFEEGGRLAAEKRCADLEKEVVCRLDSLSCIMQTMCTKYVDYR